MANPEYPHHRRLTQRAEAEAAAKEAAARTAAAARAGKTMELPEVPLPPPLAPPPGLRRLPWDLLKDEIGCQITDAIVVSAREILRVTKDQICGQDFGKKRVVIQTPAADEKTRSDPCQP